MGPGATEIEFTERTGEPLIAFMMDKTEPGAFNLPIFRMFADPFNTAGLVIDPTMHTGFRFEIWDIKDHTRVSWIVRLRCMICSHNRRKKPLRHKAGLSKRGGKIAI